MRSINCTCDLCGRPIDVYNVGCFEKLYRWMLTKPFKDDYGYTNIMVPIEKED